MNGAPRALYAFWRTSAVYRVRVALALKGLLVEERVVDLEAGGQRDPEFLALNPMAAIPALLVDGTDRPLTQSLAILEYLEEIAPAMPLLPPDPIGRARVRSLALGMAADTHPFIVPRVRQHLMQQHGFNAEKWRGWQTHWVQTGLEAFERRLVDEPGAGLFSHGDTVTMADVCLCSIVVLVRVFGIRVEGTPTIDAIVARCEATEAFAKADPYAQAGAPERPRPN